MGYVALQYAEALFGIALEEGQIDETLVDFDMFNNAIDDEIYKFLNHPKISKKDKKVVIEKALTNNLLKNFIFVMIDNFRIELLEESLIEFKKIVDRQNNIMKVWVYSKKELNTEQKKDLKTNLKKKHNRKIELKNIVDSSIAGGLRIEYEGMILDDTINNYLQTLKANLTK
ncbi:MAG: ATP synthase subunit delta [Candidatus Izimaplasma bacterium HR2]|nr:MAG: ATP synthase subunit delta [Candidatus Izimaplasma bacterium HR2]